MQRAKVLYDDQFARIPITQMDVPTIFFSPPTAMIKEYPPSPCGRSLWMEFLRFLSPLPFRRVGNRLPFPRLPPARSALAWFFQSGPLYEWCEFSYSTRPSTPALSLESPPSCLPWCRITDDGLEISVSFN